MKEMKKIFGILMLAMLAVCTLTMVSCHSDSDPEDNPLVGTWVLQHQVDEDYDSYVFKGDGTGYMTIYRINSGNNATFPFTYSYGENVLSIAYLDGDREMWRVTITGKTMTLTDGTYLYSYQKK